ncbi:MAG: hypothetical protein ACFFAU_17535 [Candidatus Hodarchaeota archaeon]
MAKMLLMIVSRVCTEISILPYNKLLANTDDINSFTAKTEDMAVMAGWRNTGWKHISIFEEEGLDDASELIKHIMVSSKDNEPADKFTLFDPIEELF